VISKEQQRQHLRACALAAPRGHYELQTSNSFRRIGQRYGGDGDVLCGTTQRSDGHPDLHAAPGVLEFIVAACPDVVIELLDALERAEEKLRSCSTASKGTDG
jgi:hypothetical protein